MFYSRSVVSDVHEFKEPREKILWISSTITKNIQVIYGHTHEVRHEMMGPVEHLNSGTWSPAFKDVECHIAADLKPLYGFALRKTTRASRNKSLSI